MTHKRDYSRIKKIFVTVVVVISAVMGIYLSEGKNMQIQTENAPPNVMNIMILGVDKREDDVGRSDTLMVFSYDKESGEANLLSIPRDTRIKFPNGNYEKINHAYAYGGFKETKKLVENLLDIKIDNYVLIDTKAFPKIIDAMGGLLLYIDKRMYYEDPWDDDGLIIDLYPGEQYLNGDRAIQYVRYRDDEGDLGRIKRQQKFVKAVLNELMSAETLPKLPEILKIAGNSVETDFQAAEIVAFADEIRKVYQAGLNSEMIKGRSAYYKDISYYTPDIEAVRTNFRETMKIPLTEEFLQKAHEDNDKYKSEIPPDMKFEELPPGSENSDYTNSKELSASDIEISVLNCSGVNGQGKKAADILKERGFKIGFVGNGGSSDKAKTTLEVPEGCQKLFSDLPFKCAIIENNKKHEATLNIGLDFDK